MGNYIWVANAKLARFTRVHALTLTLHMRNRRPCRAQVARAARRLADWPAGSFSLGDHQATWPTRACRWPPRSPLASPWPPFGRVGRDAHSPNRPLPTRYSRTVFSIARSSTSGVCCTLPHDRTTSNGRDAPMSSACPSTSRSLSAHLSERMLILASPTCRRATATQFLPLYATRSQHSNALFRMIV